MALLARIDRTVVMTTHELPFDTVFFTRAVLLARGRIVAEGRPEAVLSSDHIAAAWGVPVRLRSVRAASTAKS
jgi:iron complex transport system ATP-binding protein